VLQPTLSWAQRDRVLFEEKKVKVEKRVLAKQQWYVCLHRDYAMFIFVYLSIYGQSPSFVGHNVNN